MLGKMFGWINGLKTILGMIAAVATFILLVCNKLGDGFQYADVDIILAGFSAMMLALGLGHKAIKIEDSLKK